MPARRVALPWPASRYVPGRGPHPLRAGGHGGCGLAAGCAPETALDRGLDLLAAHFVWEAHEAFELAWHALDDPRAKAAPLGLIKLCAAVLRANAGDVEAASQLLRAGERALREHTTVRGAAIAPVVAEVTRFVLACASAKGDRALLLTSLAAR